VKLLLGEEGGARLRVSLLLQYGGDHMQTSRAAFFLLAKLSVLAKKKFPND
jgi:cellobiose-specific phosphotransferase system component IIA